MIGFYSPIDRLTYDATLAELTSLEEMMRQFMGDGSIHDDVITTLWQVYSTNLSHLLDLCSYHRCQARSAPFRGHNDGVQ